VISANPDTLETSTMDPNATLRLILQHRAEADYEEAFYITTDNRQPKAGN